MATSGESGGAPGYPRSVRSPRGEARRAELAFLRAHLHVS